MDKIRTAAVCDICVMCTVFVLSFKSHDLFLEYTTKN